MRLDNNIYIYTLIELSIFIDSFALMIASFILCIS